MSKNILFNLNLRDHGGNTRQEYLIKEEQMLNRLLTKSSFIYNDEKKKNLKKSNEYKDISNIEYKDEFKQLKKKE